MDTRLRRLGATALVAIGYGTSNLFVAHEAIGPIVLISDCLRYPDNICEVIALSLSIPVKDLRQIPVAVTTASGCYHHWSWLRTSLHKTSVPSWADRFAGAKAQLSSSWLMAAKN